MRSLTSRALEALNSKETLIEVVEECKSSQLLIDASSKSPDFWKRTLKRLHGGALVSQRGDLETGDEWAMFCDGLCKGFSFKYGSDADGILKPLYAGNLKRRFPMYEATIDGVLPLPGTDCIWIEIEQDGEESVQMAFFGPNCARNIASYLVEVYMYNSVWLDINGFEDGIRVINLIGGQEGLIELEKVIERTAKGNQIKFDPDGDAEFLIQIKRLTFK